MSDYPLTDGQFFWNQGNLYAYDVPTYAELQPSPYGMQNPYYDPMVPGFYYSYQPYSPEIRQEMPTEVHYFEEEKPDIRAESPEIKEDVISLNNLEEMAQTSASRNTKNRRKRSGSRDEFYDYDYVDTNDVCCRVIQELEHLGVSQSLFAEKVIQRTQGTLSDILRCPRPWSELKSGRQTYIKMLRWLEMSEEEKFEVLHAESTPEVSHPTKRRRIEMRDEMPRKQRIAFSAFQKKTLDALFSEVKNPSQELKEVLAKKLSLSISTVSNYFMNERRKLKRMSHREASQEE